MVSEEVVRLAFPLLSVAVPMLVLPSMNVTIPLGVPAPLAAAAVTVRVTGPPRAGAVDETLSAVVVAVGRGFVGAVPDDLDPPQPRITSGRQAAASTAIVTNSFRLLRSPNSNRAAAATKGTSREARSGLDELVVPMLNGEASWTVNCEVNVPLLAVTGPNEHASPDGKVDGQEKVRDAGTDAPETGVTVTVADPPVDVDEIVTLAGLMATVKAGVVVITTLAIAPDE